MHNSQLNQLIEINKEISNKKVKELNLKIIIPKSLQYQKHLNWKN